MTARIDAFNAGVQRARDAYRADQLRAAGRCIRCEQEHPRHTYLCPACLRDKAKAAAREVEAS